MILMIFDCDRLPSENPGIGALPGQSRRMQITNSDTQKIVLESRV